MITFQLAQTTMTVGLTLTLMVGAPKKSMLLLLPAHMKPLGTNARKLATPTMRIKMVLAIAMLYN